MKKLSLFFILIFLFSLIPDIADAAITIQRTGSRRYPSIQAALKSAVSGDIIFLSRGTYTGTGNGNNIIWPNIDNLTILGAGPADTVISAEALGRAIKVVFPVNLTIESLAIKDCRITGNGAALYLADNSKLWLKNVMFKNCTARGRSIVAGTGGAIQSSGSSVFASDCTFNNNSATFRGGVAYGGTWEASRCTFNGNRASASGGVAFEGDWKATDCIFFSNNSSGGGGVAEADKGEAINCIFNYNSAPYGGVAWGGTWDIYNCTFYNNSSPKGAVAYISVWNAVNSIFWGSNNQFEGGSGSLKYCDVQGGFRGLGLKECISSNPMFKNAAAGDFQLTVDSPCIDTGAFEGAPAKDIDGKDRPYPPNAQVSLYDIGAHEFYRPPHDIYVSPLGKESNAGKSDSPVKTIQRALLLAGEGRTIFLNRGYYQGPVNNWPKYIQDITIKSQSGTWKDTTVSGIGIARVFDLSSVPGGTRGAIDGITITAGTTADAGGGALFPAGSSIVLKNCRIEGNSAGQGGGMYNGRAVNCIFSNNTAKSGGGAYNSSVERCMFIGNSAEAGGGTYTDRADDSIVNCLFADNSGGGIFLDNSASITNCTLYNNAPYNIFTDTGYATIMNCISWNGDIGKSKKSANWCYYSDIQGGDYSSQDGNIASDPRFTSPSKNNYRLSPGSPCINAGVPGKGVPKNDLDGRFRFGAIDMGAYKYSDADVSLLQPNTIGISMNAGGKYPIKWKVTDRNGNSASYPFASIYFSKNGGAAWQAVEQNFTADETNTYRWTVPALLSDKCRIAVEAARTAGVPASRSESAYDFAIKDTVPPKIRIGDIPQYIGSGYKFIWSAADVLPVSDAVTLEFSPNGGIKWKVLEDGLPMSGTYAFYPAPGMNIDHPECMIRISARDQAGNVSSKEAVFGIDTKAPSAGVNITKGAIPRMGVLRITPYDERGIAKIRVNTGYSAEWQEYSIETLPPRITIAPPAGGIYDIRVEVYDPANNVTKKTKTIKLVLPGSPEVTSILADTTDVGRSRRISRATVLTAGIYDYQAGLKSVKFIVNAAGKAYSSSVSTEQSASDFTYYTASAKVDISPESAHFNVTVEASDAQGNASIFTVTSSSIKGVPSVIGKPVNLPNPFRPKYGEGTAIRYSLSADSDIKLVIYDEKGKAAWLRNFSAGAEGGKMKQNNVFWNGKNDLGYYMNNGIYAYSIASGGKVIAKGQLTVTD
jgi:hypothetical protein